MTKRISPDLSDMIEEQRRALQGSQKEKVNFTEASHYFATSIKRRKKGSATKDDGLFGGGIFQ